MVSFKWNSIGLNVLMCFVLQWGGYKPKVHRHIGNTVRPSSDKVIASNAFGFSTLFFSFANHSGNRKQSFKNQTLIAMI